MTPEQIITEALDNYESLLISYAREITGELESAKDSVRETFLRLSSQNLKVLQPRLRRWLFVVCRRSADVRYQRGLLAGAHQGGSTKSRPNYCGR